MKRVLSIILGIILVFGVAFSSFVFAEEASINKTTTIETSTDAETATDIKETSTDIEETEKPADSETNEEVESPKPETSTEIPETSTDVKVETATDSGEEKEETTIVQNEYNNYGDSIFNQGDLNIDMDINSTVVIPTFPSQDEQTPSSPNFGYIEDLNPSAPKDEVDLFIPDTGSTSVTGAVIALGLAAGAIILLKKKNSD